MLRKNVRTLPKKGINMNTEIKNKYIDFLTSICKIETPSDNKANIDKMVDFIQKFAIEQNLQTERFSFSEAGDFLLIKTRECENEKPILLMAHMDTVHKIGAFGDEVVSSVDNWLYGPGVMDCKGGIALGLCVMERLKADSNLKRPVYFLLTSDEEVSSRFSGQTGKDLIIDTAKRAAAVFNLEPSRPRSVTVGRKGILKMRAEIFGVAAHAGNAYFDGASAIKEAAHMVLEIEGLSQREGITYNCGVINGGTVPNTVADKCSIDIDIRVSSMEEMQKAEQTMCDLSQRNVVENTHRTVTVMSKRPPMMVNDKNLQLLEKWNIAAKNLGMDEFKGIIKGGGSDAAYTVMAGTPTLCSCGPIGYGEHTRNEKVDLSTFDDIAELISNTIKLI